MCRGVSAASASVALTSSRGRKIADGRRSHDASENNWRTRRVALNHAIECKRGARPEKRKSQLGRDARRRAACNAAAASPLQINCQLASEAPERERRPLYVL
jgi:hypothetical protein